VGLWRWRQAITVDAPPDVVFDYLSDFARLSDVIIHKSSLLEDDDGQPKRFGVGAAVKLVWIGGGSEGGPTGHLGDLTITEIVPSERIAWTIEPKGTMARIGIPDAEMELRPVDLGTRVEMTSQYRWPLWFNVLILTLWIFFLPIVVIAHRLQSRAGLRRLKQGLAARGSH
jgi:uncharacterized membrane protein